VLKYLLRMSWFLINECWKHAARCKGKNLVCLSTLSYPARNAHALYYIAICGQSCSNIFLYREFGKSLCTYKRCWKWCPRASVQAWTRLILFANTFCRSDCEMFLMYTVIAVFNSLKVRGRLQYTAEFAAPLKYVCWSRVHSKFLNALYIHDSYCNLTYLNMQLNCLFLLWQV
jgi:hypothetical protein